MTAAQPWLPPTALFDGALTATVGKTVEVWRSRWGASPKPCSIRLGGPNGLDALPKLGWRTTCGALRFCLDARMREQLLGVVLQSRRAAHASTPPDRRLLDALCQRICSDLLDQNSNLFGVEVGGHAPLADDAGLEDQQASMRFRITGAAGPLGFLVVSTGAAARARKSLAKPSDRRPSLEKRTRATATQNVKVGAFVGAGQVSVSDLASLAIGDVLVLDRALTSPFDITFNSRTPDKQPVEVRRDGIALLIQPLRKQADGFS